MDPASRIAHACLCMHMHMCFMLAWLAWVCCAVLCCAECLVAVISEWDLGLKIWLQQLAACTGPMHHVLCSRGASTQLYVPVLQCSETPPLMNLADTDAVMQMPGEEVGR